MSDADRTVTGQAPELLVDRLLAEAPSRRVLDLACGVGRHARRLAEQGCDVVAIDASEAVLEQARAKPVPENVELLLGDMGAVERMVRGHFGAALCLGNALPHLLSPESLSRMFIGLKRRLLPGAPFLLQVLNYDRILAGELRALPVEYVEAPSPPGDTGLHGQLLVVRLLEPRDDGIVLHTTSTLRHRPAEKPMMEIVDTRAALLRGWRRAELETLLQVARLEPRQVFGDLSGAPYDPRRSLELVMVAA